MKGKKNNKSKMREQKNRTIQKGERKSGNGGKKMS